jgi:dimethylamine monooxygenase subunit A
LAIKAPAGRLFRGRIVVRSSTVAALGIIGRMSFDFDAAVVAPFRMQPGLRRLAPGARQLTPLAPGSRHQREKLAVLSAFWADALVARAGFDAAPAFDALCAHAMAEHPAAWGWAGGRAEACALGTAVDRDGRIDQLSSGAFGLGDEVSRCLAGLPAEWRQAGLISLAFAEDFAVIDGRDSTIPWLAVALPSHWAPRDKVGRPFAEVHAPVADNTLLLRAAASLAQLVTGDERWERFVWNITDQPRLHAHPARSIGVRWADTRVDEAWFRSERQSFIPVPAARQAVFTIHVEVQPLAEVLRANRARAVALHDAVATMSAGVLAYRGLTGVRDALLAHLQAQARSHASAA